MPSALQQFRNRYPQYNHLDDETVATQLHTRYYSHIDPVQFRADLGLAVPKPEPEPTMGDRLDQKLKPSDPLEEQDVPWYLKGQKLAFDIATGLGPQATAKATGPDSGFFGNLTRKIRERASTLAGHAVRGIVGRPGEALTDKADLGTIVVGTDWGDDDPADGQFRIRYMRNPELKKLRESDAGFSNYLADSIPDKLLATDLGAEERNTPEQIKEQFRQGNVLGTAFATLKFAGEQGGGSLPDMVATMSGWPALAAYMGARSSEIGDTRAANKGMAEATMQEQLEALPAAVGSALFEKYGAERVLGVFGKAGADELGEEILNAGLKHVAKRTAKAGGVEAATEAFQEGVIEYLGEKLGTDAPMSWEEATERGFFGALAGGIFGGAVGGAVGTGEAMDASAMRYAMENIKQQQEFTEEFGDPADTEAEPEPEPAPPPEPGYVDSRLKRDVYRANLAGLADQLTPESDVSPVLDDQGRIVGRTPSINPDWFQGMAGTEFQMTVPEVRNAVEKALTGQPLGVRQERVVKLMLDTIGDSRAEAVDYAYEQLSKARQARRRARSEAAEELAKALIPISAYEQEYAGELFEEQEYLPEMDAEARIVDELAYQLDKLGMTERVDTILQESSTTLDAIKRLEKLRNEQPSTAASAAAATNPETARSRTETQEAAGTTTTDRRQESLTPTTERRAGDRRQDTARRDRVTRLSVDELMAELYTDPLTGIPNERAFNEDLPNARAVGSVDVDGLGGVNDHLGHDAGDALLKAVATALKKTGAEVYHKSGDEFYVLGDSRQQVADAIARAQEDLAKQVLEADRGKVEGIRLTAGVGRTKSDADTRMERTKKEREARGERKGKGQLPPGGVLYSSRPLNMAAGSKYVGLIGQNGELPLSRDESYQLGNGKTVRFPDKPVRRKHIMDALQRRFGNKIYQGRVRGKSRLGFYRPGWGEIRIKNANDLEVTAHETAHWIDDRFPWVSELYKQKKFEKELKGVSYDVKLIHEGYAEFMRLWMTQEHMARQNAPGFYDAWMAALDKPGRGELKETLFEMQELMHAWYLQGARARLQDRYGKPDMTITERAGRYLRRFEEKFLQKIFDDLRTFKVIEREIRGAVANAARSGYNTLRLARGAHGVMQAILHRGTIDWAENGDLVFTGKGIKQIFAPVSDRMDEMQSYMVARRAQELLSQGRENHVRPDEIRAGLALAEVDPELKEVFDQWLAFNKRMFDFYESSGLLSAESRAAIEEMNKNYVPFNRIVDNAMGVEKGPNRSHGSPFIRLKGGTHNINDVFESIIGNTSHLVRMALVNRGKQNFYEMLAESDDQTAALYASKIDTDIKPTQIDKDQVLKTVLEGMGLSLQWYRMAKEMPMDGAELTTLEMIDRLAENLEPMVTFFQFGQDPKGNVDFYFNNGKKQFYEIADPMLWDSINHVGPRAHNLALGMLGGFANALRKGVTLTPTFQAKNFIRDTMNAFTLSKGKIVPGAAATKALFERIYNDEHYWEYMLNGGGFAAMADADGINRDRILDVGKGIGWKADQALGAFEYANRIAEFKALRGKGWSARDATLAGREISTDFAMRGSSEILRWFTTSIPFLNARLQGLYRMGREVAQAEEGKAKIIGGQAFSYSLRSLISITIPSMVLYALNKDDERYQELEEWIKDLHWVIFTGEGEDDYVLIPKPFETGFIWGTLPERMMEYHYTRDEGELADAMLWMALETFQLDLVPQFYAPIDDLRQNKSWTGAPIIPEYLQNVEPGEQYRVYTSDAMIALGRKLNISPLQAEYLVRGYFGTLGAWSLGTADWILDKTVGDISGGGEEPAKGIKDNFLLSPFVNDGPLRRTKSENDFYEMLQESRKIANTMRLIQDRTPERIEQYISEPRRQVMLGLNDMLNTGARRMRELRTMMDQVRGNPEMSGEEKREVIQELQRATNELAREIRLAIDPELVEELVQEAEAAAQQATQQSPTLRPFASGEFVRNQDGSVSTERTVTIQDEDGLWVNVPSLWMGPNGPVDFGENEDRIAEAMQEYEKEGARFKRFKSVDAATKAAKERSDAGGAFSGS